MGISISSKDLSKLMKSKNINKESLGLKELKSSKTEAQNRMQKSIEKLKALRPDDEIYFNGDYTKCMIKISDVTLLSNNSSLRLGAKQMKDYKSLWIDRIKNLVSPKMLEEWEKNTFGNKILIEFCFEVNHDFMDYDGRIAAFKAPLDGLEKAGLLKDDSWRNLSMILGKQRKSKDKKPNLFIMLSIEPDEDRYYSEEFLGFLDKN